MSYGSNNLFYDERISCIPGPPPCPDMAIPGRPPYEHPGGCCPDVPIVNPYRPGVPNPVPTRYFYPIPPCGPWPHRPEEFFVLKRQLNEILKSIAKADIFKDKTETGTTIRCGGIEKGTKLGEITFSELIEKLLYPSGDQPVDPEEYVKMGELEDLVKAFLATVAVSGSYNDLQDKPTIPDVANLVSSEQLSQALESYVANTTFATTLVDYVAKTDMSTYLSSYVSSESLETTLGNYVTSENLATTLEDYATKDDISGLATTEQLETVRESIPSMTYPTDKDTEVVNAIGGFVVGDSLEGMTIWDIFEKLLTKQPDPGP